MRSKGRIVSHFLTQNYALTVGEIRRIVGY